MAIEPDTLNRPSDTATFETDRIRGLINFKDEGDQLLNYKDLTCSREEGFSLIKPKIVEALTILYLKADKQVSTGLLSHTQQFTELITLEQERLKNITQDFQPTKQFNHYLFECFIPFLNLYVVKLISDDNEETRQRRGENFVSSYAQTLKSKLPILLDGIPKQKSADVQELLIRFCEDDATLKNLLSNLKEFIALQSKTALNEDGTTSLKKTSTQNDRHIIGDDNEGESLSFEQYESQWNAFKENFIESPIQKKVNKF